MAWESPYRLSPAASPSQPHRAAPRPAPTRREARPPPRPARAIITIVRTCVDALPTTVLTNGMVFRGRGRRALESMPRKGLALQISLDSATADLHDAHRGAGSWQKAVDGIRLALSLGFRVRVAATVAAPAPGQLDDFHRFLDELGIAADDQVIRPIAAKGLATNGLS